jgi:hypothetical protein
MVLICTGLRGESPPVLNIALNEINLYFYENRLITVYIHLFDDLTDTDVLAVIQHQLQAPPVSVETDSGKVWGWANQNSFLGIVKSQSSQRVYLYYTLREFNVFESRLL